MLGIARSLALCSASVMLIAAGETASGDPARGLAVVTRQASTCVLCHAGPWPNPHLQGNIGPNLAGVGTRLDAAAIRARLIDPQAAMPGTVMPSFGTIEGRVHVGAAWQGKPILTGAEIEDATAYLAGLR